MGEKKMISKIGISSPLPHVLFHEIVRDPGKPARGGALLGLLLAAALSPWTCAAAEPPSSAQEPAADNAKCELTIEGLSVERVLLRDAQDATHEIDNPQQSTSLPAGRYSVDCIQWQGGGKLYPKRQDWFTLKPDQPHRLTLAEPVRPEIKATRGGRNLTLNYALIGADGRDRNRQFSSQPPTFKVFKNDQEIGSGTFRYG